MTTTDTRPTSDTPDDAASGQRYLIVSTDSHVGPPLEVLREYCPKADLETYDSFTHDMETRTGTGILACRRKLRRRGSSRRMRASTIRRSGWRTWTRMVSPRK